MAIDFDGKGILEEGRNCWRIAKAYRAAFLIDSASYFSAFAEVVEQATRQVFIIGWDIDSRIELVPGDDTRRMPSRLGELLKTLVMKRPHLHVYMLCWDFALVYALEREFLPVYKLDWAHRRLHFRYDGNHPVGASHHQKIVVVDDKVAFVGGIDLANRRWDRPGHTPVDPLRVDVDGKMYPPTHDVQMLVDGDAAAALGDLARERWKRGVGRKLRRPPVYGGDYWPRAVEPNLKDVKVAIARTEPLYRKYPEVREIERLHIDAIASARRFIYIENQYITSRLIATALSARLQEQNGPEIVMVVPEKTTGWLSESTMDVCRTRLLRELRSADAYNRLRIYFPAVPDLGKHYVEVHSKVFVIDDDLVRVGSSNLCDRSMGLDTECDLAIEAKGDWKIRKAIARFRDRLLGQHLDVPPTSFSETVETEQSIIAAVEKLRGKEHTLVPFEREAPEWLEKMMPDGMLLDPERPIEAERLMKVLLPEEHAKSSYGNLLAIFITLLIMLGLAGMWRWSPLGDWINLQTILHEANLLKKSPLMPLFVYLFYVIGGLVFFPVMVMIVATAIIFEPIKGFLFSLSGCLLSASFTYLVGRTLGRNVVRWLSGNMVNRLRERLGKNHLTALLALRLVPVAPFTAVNIFAGASRINFGLYFITTFLGLFPGIFAITIFGRGLWTILREPTSEGIAFLAVWAAMIVLLFLGFRKWFARYAVAREESRSDGKK